MWSLPVSGCLVSLVASIHFIALCLLCCLDFEMICEVLEYKHPGGVKVMTDCGWRQNSGNSLSLSSVITCVLPTYTYIAA